MTTTTVSRHTDTHGRYIISDSLDVRTGRYERIRAARDSGLTLEEVGQMFDPALSKQRVATILRRGLPRDPGRPTEPEDVKVARRAARKLARKARKDA